MDPRIEIVVNIGDLEDILDNFEDGYTQEGMALLKQMVRRAIMKSNAAWEKNPVKP